MPLAGYRDGFGNWCGRFTAPAGRIRISSDTAIRDSGLPDPVTPDARQHPIEELPDEALVYLLASRFCESDRMLALAWQLFGATAPGRPRVQAVCDFADGHIALRLRPGPPHPLGLRGLRRKASASAATTRTSRSPSAGR